MKSCPKCNTLNADDFNFCTNCGYSAPVNKTVAASVRKNRIFVPILIVGLVL